MRQAQQSDISALVVAFLFIVFALAALAQCRAEPAHAGGPSAPARAPACRRWKDGFYRQAVMRRIGDTFVISYEYCKAAKR